ncbi:MAG: flavin monoamine oxidase family protein [Gemmatimonadaceae bacterium]|jgi:monoamine oxidase
MSSVLPVSPIAILGGGVAGLCAARLLHAARVPFVLLEARDRLGGRVLTVDATGAPADNGFDLGASWFWPRTQPRLAALVAELGLSAFVQLTDGDVLFERMVREGPQRYHGGPQQALSFRLAGGSAALVRALAAGLPRERLRLRTAVTGMQLEDNGVTLMLAAQGDASSSPERITVSHVIAALPPRLLGATVTFAPTLDADTLAAWHDVPTWMAPHAKFFALYDRPFWSEAGLSGTAQSMVGPLAEIHDATTASGQAALLGFVGVGAEQRAAVGDMVLTRACEEQLRRLFGDEARRPQATLLKDWAADPFTATPADRVPGGHPAGGDRRWVTGLWERHLTLGGSEVSPLEPGYLAGAVLAAERAASAAIAATQERRGT